MAILHILEISDDKTEITINNYKLEEFKEKTFNKEEHKKTIIDSLKY